MHPAAVMNVFNLMRFLFIVAFLAPILRFIYNYCIDSAFLETIINKIKSLRQERSQSSSSGKRTDQESS